eukprot:TRINITY_DN5378_c0_g1_i1.p3 TRINITY_DN5378_c0_g1~~TRINITY_DN5378_c0_g1_i1.p3  ORF type:complete len:114 (-),score=33.52 TRINITY_DN5378_c0_g1_i1:1-342(-)
MAKAWVFEHTQCEVIFSDGVEDIPVTYLSPIGPSGRSNLSSNIGVQRAEHVPMDTPSSSNSLPIDRRGGPRTPVSYTHLRAHETVLDLVCRLLLEKKKKCKTQITSMQTDKNT